MYSTNPDPVTVAQKIQFSPWSTPEARAAEAFGWYCRKCRLSGSAPTCEEAYQGAEDHKATDRHLHVKPKLITQYGIAFTTQYGLYVRDDYFSTREAAEGAATKTFAYNLVVQRQVTDWQILD